MVGERETMALPKKKRKLTRKDYEALMYGDGGKRRRRRSHRGGGAVTRGGRISPETFMLAHLMSKANKNAKQRKAVVDSMNASQMKHVGRLVRGVLNTRRKLPKKQLRQLIRDRNFIDALVKGKGSLDTRKKILKDQRGGFIGALLPIAASLAAPAIQTLGKIFKL